MFGSLVSAVRRISGTRTGRVLRGTRQALSNAHPAYWRASKALERGDEQRLMVSIAQLEQSGIVAPRPVSAWLESSMRSDAGRQKLSKLAGDALLDQPASRFLLFLRCTGLAHAGDFHAAHTLISEALTAHCSDRAAGRGRAARMRTDCTMLGSIWSAVDAIARDQMRWAIDEGAGDHDIGRTCYGDLEFVRAFRSLDRTKVDYLATLTFAEPLLQGKHNERYLEQCTLAFERATSLFQRLRVIRAMWRQGRRRIPDYTGSYDLARDHFRSLQSDLDALCMPQGSKVAATTVRLLRSAHAIAEHLDCEDEAARLHAAMLSVVERDSGSEALWVVVNALSRDIANHDLTLRLIGSRTPTMQGELHDFFQWAARMGEFDRAHTVYDDLSRTLKEHTLALPYVNVLQRCGRFAQAEQVARDIHTAMLRRPWTVQAVESLAMVRRIGEMAFCADTARRFLATPQPQNPRGVIVTMPRTIEQLRRIPLVVLLEWKKMGWAVVCPFEGMLPRQETGLQAVDALWNSIAQGAFLRSGIIRSVNGGSPAVADFGNGHLQVGGIDLSHSLWEEAAVNRRLYTPVWTCPALQRSLTNLAAWSVCVDAVLDHVKAEMDALGLPVGFQVSHTARLPDALVRARCLQVRSPKTFFCVQANNAYENYFKNFDGEISTRMSLRNMTAHPELRTPAMPLPEDVRYHFTEHENADPRPASDPQAVTRVRRSRGGAAGNAEVVDTVTRRIEDWKRSGGHVACAFGKVVCDASVPHDGGPCHRSLKDWICHTIEAATGSNTLLLIKPHPHETRQEIGCFLNETFREICPDTLPENVIFLGYDWFRIDELAAHIDLALVYNGTVAVEMAVLGIPTLVCADFAQVDYPVGHSIARSRTAYEKAVRFEVVTPVDPDTAGLARSWLELMRGDTVAVPYRYHSRSVTNVVVYPPWWVEEDFRRYTEEGDAHVTRLAQRLPA